MSQKIYIGYFFIFYF